jgi:hypothetical protein
VPALGTAQLISQGQARNNLIVETVQISYPGIEQNDKSATSCSILGILGMAALATWAETDSAQNLHLDA